jgi:hypothetical protein
MGKSDMTPKGVGARRAPCPELPMPELPSVAWRRTAPNLWSPACAQIANRIKAKGLCKLRWYCQLCSKQCRDENGFKCHQMSDSHRRQMELFGENPDKVVDQFSQEFEESFLEHMRRAWVPRLGRC